MFFINGLFIYTIAKTGGKKENSKLLLINNDFLIYQQLKW